MSTGSSHFNADTYVTGANPAPGRQLAFEYPVRSGTGWTTASGSRNDGGIGLNVYLAGGTGVSGSIPVTIVGGSGSGGGGGNATPASSGTAGVFPFQSTGSYLLLDANPSRIMFSIFNDTNQTFLICLGPTASLSSWDISLMPQQYYECPYPGYVGKVTGIGYLSGTGNIRVKEMTP